MNSNIHDAKPAKKKTIQKNASVFSLNKIDANCLSLDQTLNNKEPEQNKLPSSALDKKPDASISLAFSREDEKCRLVGRDHFGQLYVQKPFYPEGPEVCHVVIVHPPGGVVGGDRLEIASRVGAAANVQITTPGAAKWYKANGHVSHQNVQLDVKAGGALEWLPQETIFFDNAEVELDHTVTLAKDSSYIGCEIFCFGRTAFGESFNGGRIRQKVNIRCDGKLIWYEQLNLAGGGMAMKSPLVLADKTVCATLIAVSDRTHTSELINTLREDADKLANGVGHLGVSQVKSVLVARYLGDSSEIARQIMLRIWGILRPAMLGRKAEVPRMWNT
ncbi:urease accessory protein UreD [Nitrosomonas aestuarii]|uniref:urease accessory protein UreD n=1 Tax=Nitrosomonas aestuarii TaxID=52441 RepID=UPI000D3284FD|nr:urease accessory protein UreD [Nitrosomonas aestuarii]PTN13260.1 urease accessory protein [Nitrosomonas aestuarii]